MSRPVYGVQPVREVLRAHGAKAGPLRLQTPPTPKLEGLLRLATHKGVAVLPTRRGDLDRMTEGGQHQGAFIEAPALVIAGIDELYADVASDASAIVVCLDGIMDPQNFGAVIRCAVALGPAWVLWPEHGSAPLTPATFRASAGAIEHVRLCRVRALPEVLVGLRDRGAQVVTLEGQSDVLLSDVDLAGRAVLVLGSEDRGVKPGVRRAAGQRARLPMTGIIDSLNVSVAAAVALYEVKRQRAQIQSVEAHG